MRRVVIALLLSLGGPALAHDVRGTSLFLDFDPDRVDVEVDLPVQQLQLVLRWPESEARAYIEQHLSAHDDAGQRFQVVATTPEVQSIDGADFVVVHATLTPPKGASARRFTLDYDGLVHQVVSHNVYVFVRSDPYGGFDADQPRIAGLMHYQRRMLLVDRGPASRWLAARGALATLEKKVFAVFE